MQAPTVSFSGSVICGPPARRALVGGNHYAELLAKETGRYLRFLGRIGRCPRNPRLRGRSCAGPNGSLLMRIGQVFKVESLRRPCPKNAQVYGLSWAKTQPGPGCVGADDRAG